MLGLFERSPRGGTKAFYRISKFICVQKLLHFEVRDFGRISYKKTVKIDVLRYITPNVSIPLNFVQMSWSLHQMTRPYKEANLRWLFLKIKEAFLKILEIGNSMPILDNKWPEMSKLGPFFSQNWHKIANLFLYHHMWGNIVSSPLLKERVEKFENGWKGVWGWRISSGKRRIS